MVALDAMSRTKVSADGIPIDASIVDVIERLRASGYDTVSCCSGMSRDHPELLGESEEGPQEVLKKSFVYIEIGESDYSGTQNPAPIEEIRSSDSLEGVSHTETLREFRKAATEADGDWVVQPGRFEGKERFLLVIEERATTDEERLKEWKSLCSVLESKSIQQ